MSALLRASNALGTDSSKAELPSSIVVLPRAEKAWVNQEKEAATPYSLAGLAGLVMNWGASLD